MIYSFVRRRFAVTALLVMFASLGAISQTFPYEVFDDDLPPASVYKERRERLLQQMAPRTMCVVLSADVRNRQNDVDFEYRQSSDMLYLCGSPTPASTLVLIKDGVVAVDLEDEILKASVVTHGGAVVHEGVKG